MATRRQPPPLWMPTGSVRGLIALSVTGGFLAGVVDPEVWLAVAAAYFGDAAILRKRNNVEGG